MSAFKNLKREFSAFKRDPPDGFSAGPKDANDMLHWEAVFIGPPDTPYEGGLFALDVQFPVDYPFQPPVVQFITKVYHCNVGENGRIGLNILNDEWSPALRLEKLMLSISALLAEPNPNIPMMEDIAYQYMFHRDEHDRVAREWTEMYAI